MNYPLALYGSEIHLENLFIYNTLMTAAKQEKEVYTSLVKRVDDLLDKYAKEYPDLLEEVARLKLEIRLHTKGTPTTEPMDAAAPAPVLRSDPNFSEQQYNAHSEALKRAYRKVATLAHPDRGGTADAFKEVAQAYANRDLAHLTDIFIRLSKHGNLYWQQSEDGIYYASTELERPRAMMEKLKAQGTYAIARHHMTGAPWKAIWAMKEHLDNEIKTLQNELNYVKAENENRNRKENNSDIIIENESGASSESKAIDYGYKGENYRQGSADQKGPVSAGEGSYSPRKWYGEA